MSSAAGVAWPLMQSWAELAGVLVNLLGFYWLYRQLHSTRRASENQTRWEIEQVSYNVYRMLVEVPTLRPYFYADATLDGKSPDEVNRVLAATELILDYFETIVVSAEELDNTTEHAWIEYMRKLYDRSPVMRQFLEDERRRYTSLLWDKLTKRD